MLRGPCAVYGSQKPFCEVTSQAEAGDRGSYVSSSYAAGRQLSDIRMMTAVSSEDPEHLHMPRLLGNNAFQKKGTIMVWLPMQTNTQGVVGDCTNRVARQFGCVRRICMVRDDLLEVRSTGYLSRRHQSFSEELVSTITSVRRGARYDVGSVRFSNKSAHSGPSPVPSV